MALHTRRALIEGAAGIAVAWVAGCRFPDALTGELLEQGRQKGLWLAQCRENRLVVFSYASDEQRSIYYPAVYATCRTTPTGKVVLGRNRDTLFGLTPARGVTIWARRFPELVPASTYESVSPDGQWVGLRVYLRGSGSGTTAEWPAGYVVDKLDGDGQGVLVAKGEANESRMFGWSADSKQLVLSLSGEVRVYTLATGGHRVIGRGLNPSWSPDGRMIAWQNADSGATIFDVQANAARTVLGGRTVPFGLQWSPDSRYLVACIPKMHLSGDTAIVVVRAGDGEYTVVLKPFGGMTNEGFGWIYLNRFSE